MAEKTSPIQATTVPSNVVDGNQLVGQVLQDRDPFVQQCVDHINQLPNDPDRHQRVMAIKANMDAGEYPVDENLDVVADALIASSSDATTIADPLFTA